MVRHQLRAWRAIALAISLTTLTPAISGAQSDQAATPGSTAETVRITVVHAIFDLGPVIVGTGGDPLPGATAVDAPGATRGFEVTPGAQLLDFLVEYEGPGPDSGRTIYAPIIGEIPVTVGASPSETVIVTGTPESPVAAVVAAAPPAPPSEAWLRVYTHLADASAFEVVDTEMGSVIAVSPEPGTAGTSVIVAPGVRQLALRTMGEDGPTIDLGPLAFEAGTSSTLHIIAGPDGEPAGVRTLDARVAPDGPLTGVRLWVGSVAGELFHSSEEVPWVERPSLEVGIGIPYLLIRNDSPDAVIAEVDISVQERRRGELDEGEDFVFTGRSGVLVPPARGEIPGVASVPYLIEGTRRESEIGWRVTAALVAVIRANLTAPLAGTRSISRAVESADGTVIAPRRYRDWTSVSWSYGFQIRRDRATDRFLVRNTTRVPLRLSVYFHRGPLNEDAGLDLDMIAECRLFPPGKDIWIDVPSARSDEYFHIDRICPEQSWVPVEAVDGVESAASPAP